MRGVQIDAPIEKTKAPTKPAVSAKYISLSVMIFLNVSNVLMMRYSKSEMKTGYISSTAILSAEVLKLVINFGLEWSMTNSAQESIALLWNAETVKLVIPALLYVIQNNLSFLALSHLSVPMFQVTSQGKLLTTAVLSRILLNKQISTMQYVSLVLLAAGVAVVQLSSLDHSSKSEGKEIVLEDDASVDSTQNLMLGLTAVLVCCFTSSLAGVYFEKIVKTKGGASLYIRNIQLSSWSILLGICTIWFNDGEAVRTNGFFHGYNGLVLGIIGIQAIAGLTVSVVMKYADNILKGFATAISIFVGAALSLWIMGTEIDYFLATGALIVIISAWMYTKYPPGTLGAVPEGNQKRSTSGKSRVSMALAMLGAFLIFCCIRWSIQAKSIQSVGTPSPRDKAPSCAVVLNDAPSLVKYKDGRLIDSFDEVYRTGEICSLDGRQDHVGKRTTAWVVRVCDTSMTPTGAKFAYANRTSSSLLQGLDISVPENGIEMEARSVLTTYKWARLPRAFLEECKRLVGHEGDHWCTLEMLTISQAMKVCGSVVIFGVELDDLQSGKLVSPPFVSCSTNVDSPDGSLDHEVVGRESKQLAVLHELGSVTLNRFGA